MRTPVVLDTEGLSALAETRPPNRLRLILDEAHRQNRDVLLPALVCAEACRGVGRTRQIEAALARARGSRAVAPVVITTTDFDVARRVGAILNAADASVEDIVDAHVVAACVPYGGGVVITSDPGDIARLAAVLPGTRIVTTPAR